MTHVIVSILIAMSAWGSEAASATQSAGTTYSPLPAQDVRSRVMSWVAERGIDDRDTLDSVGTLWSWDDAEPDTQELLDRAVKTTALCDEAFRTLIAACRITDDVFTEPDTAVFGQADGSPFINANVRLFVARYLVQARLYDEALVHFEAIPLEHVIDPATYFFYRAVCEHQLSKRDEALATLDSLLEQTSSVPPRFKTVANLMRYDLRAYRQKSLDEIARKMSDVERRLDLARGGSRVQKVEEEIVAALDKLIDQIEKQSQSAASSGMGSGDQNQSTSPAGDSVVKGTPGAGQVDEKDIGHRTGWGALPPKEETKAKNLINRNFPAHYRQAINEYFKTLANRRAQPNPSSR